MRNLREDIAELFAELDGQERYELALERVGHHKRAEATERTRQWRKDNPKRFRELRRRFNRNYEQRHPEKRRAAAQRYRDKHREKVREAWRRNTAAYRARKKAAAAAGTQQP